VTFFYSIIDIVEFKDFFPSFPTFSIFSHKGSLSDFYLSIASADSLMNATSSGSNSADFFMLFQI